jgi:hypothetical protein
VGAANESAAMNRTPRCPTSGVQVDLCECAVHRKPAHVTPGGYKVWAVKKAKPARKCHGPCQQRKASVRGRDARLLCDECHAAILARRAELATRPVSVRGQRNRPEARSG